MEESRIKFDLYLDSDRGLSFVETINKLDDFMDKYLFHLVGKEYVMRRYLDTTKSYNFKSLIEGNPLERKKLLKVKIPTTTSKKTVLDYMKSYLGGNVDFRYKSDISSPLFKFKRGDEILTSDLFNLTDNYLWEQTISNEEQVFNPYLRGGHNTYKVSGKIGLYSKSKILDINKKEIVYMYIRIYVHGGINEPVMVKFEPVIGKESMSTLINKFTCQK